MSTIIGRLPDGEPWTEEDEAVRNRVICKSLTERIARYISEANHARDTGWPEHAAILEALAADIEAALSSGAAYRRNSRVRYFESFEAA